MLERSLASTVRKRLAQFPGVVLIGPRQVGKTTLARALAAERPDSVVLDLERPADRSRLAQPSAYFPRRCESTSWSWTPSGSKPYGCEADSP
jgi:predicted AAA+ superfamily ATPase